MCLAVPGKIASTYEQGASRLGRVSFGGVTRDTLLDLVPEANVGDYVLVHVGVAISRIDEDEAQKTLELLRQMGEVAEDPEESS
jgi:hydrogenase expression/formation protein HypC